MEDKDKDGLIRQIERLTCSREQLQARLDSEKNESDPYSFGGIFGMVEAGWGVANVVADQTMHKANELMDRFREEVADAKPFAFPNESEVQAEMHWDYLQGVLHLHGLPSSLIEICGHHYKTAFVHGWKHGQEAMNGKAKG